MMRNSKHGFKMQFVALTEHIYTVLMLYAVFIGVVVFLLFLASFIAGSPSLASLAGTLMQLSIPISAVAALIALVGFYVNNKHALTVDSKDTTDDESDK